MSRITDEELDLNKVHTTMVNMTLDESDEENYIIDFKNIDNKLVVYYADGRVDELITYSLHNLNYYRYRVEKQFYYYYNKYMDQAGNNSLKLFAKRNLSIVLSLFEIFLLYNLDIHFIIKVILSLGIAMLEVFYYLVKQYDILALSNDLERVKTLDMYFKNRDEFIVYDGEARNDDFSLSVEDIWHYDLDTDELALILEDVKEDKGSVFKYDVEKYKKSNKIL